MTRRRNVKATFGSNEGKHDIGQGENVVYDNKGSGKAYIKGKTIYLWNNKISDCHTGKRKGR